MPKPLHESAQTLAEATTSTNAGLLEVEFITPGWGSSGYYSREVVEAAAPLFAVGTHMYFDHPSATEDADRPERSVRDLAAVIEEGGTVNPATGGILGKVRPLKAYADLLTDEAFTKNVGLSIRGSASDIVVGEAEGRTGPIVEGLAELDSVDFVTRAGRGGKVLSVLESAQAAQRAIDNGIAEATANDTRDALQQALRDEYDGDRSYVWVRDFDDTTVWFEAGSDGDSGLYAQAYTGAGATVALTGERTEVRVVTTYVPATRSDSNTTTQESEEDPMQQIEEARLRELEEAHGRVPTLESERDTAIRERDEARTERDAVRAVNRAQALIVENEARTQAGVEFTSLEMRGLMASLPLTEGVLDEDAFTTRVTEAVTERTATTGTVTGFGGTSTQSTGLSESDIDKAVAGAFGRTVKEA